MNPNLLLAIPLLPLLAAIIAGLGGRLIGRAALAARDHRRGGGLAACCRCIVLKQICCRRRAGLQRAGLHLAGQRRRAHAGRLPDRPADRADDGGRHLRVAVRARLHRSATCTMTPGYQRFFTYISLFTFSMLMLVMSNNFMQLFFGWEAVGVVSYLLIGFWYTRPSAIFANLKAFLVNRVGDFGFVLGIAGVALLHRLARLPRRLRGRAADRRTDADPAVPRPCVVGDDADLHLPVHRRDGQVGAGAAARVAAGFDGRPDADLGADPRRDHGDGRHLHGGAHVAAVRVLGDGAVVRAGHRRDHGASSWACSASSTTTSSASIAYSTLSQLGYMTVALGVSAYSVGDLPPDDARLLQGAAVPRRRLGDHRACTTSRTCARWAACASTCRSPAGTCWIGALALIGTPFFSGFYSKDAHHRGGAATRTAGAPATPTGACCAGVFVTALYTFRMIFMTFHGPERFDHHAAGALPRRRLGHEGRRWWRCAIPSLLIGFFTVGPVLFGGYFGDAIFVLPSERRRRRARRGVPRAAARSRCMACCRCRSGSPLAGVVDAPGCSS